MKTNYTVRPLTAQDLDAIVAIEKACFTLNWSRDLIKADLLYNDRAIYIGVEDENKQLLAYACMWIVLDQSHINSIGVAPEHQRKGLAKKMMQALIAMAEYCNAPDITLEVRESNEAAIALYTAFGFSAQGRRKKYYKDNDEDAIIMWKRAFEEDAFPEI